MLQSRQILGTLKSLEKIRVKLVNNMTTTTLAFVDDPHSGKNWDNQVIFKGRNLRDAKRYSEAKEWFYNLLKDEPNNGHYYHELARVFQAEAKHPYQTAKYYKKAIQLSHDAYEPIYIANYLNF